MFPAQYAGFKFHFLLLWATLTPEYHGSDFVLHMQAAPPTSWQASSSPGASPKIDIQPSITSTIPTSTTDQARETTTLTTPEGSKRAPRLPPRRPFPRMNQIRAIQALNKRELEAGVPPSASWHTDYRDTAFISFGGLPFELSEGDVITIFSQYGEPVFLKLARDPETGKSRGFGWLKYEDQRSTDLAVDNLGGAEIGGRLVRVDHARYKLGKDEDPEEGKVGWEDMRRRERREKGLASEEESEEEEEATVESRPLIKEERELQLLIKDHDDDDPMKAFLIDEKKKEVEQALRRASKKEGSHRHKDKEGRHRSHRSRHDDKGGNGPARDRDRDRKGSEDRGDRDRDRHRSGRKESRRERSPLGRHRDDKREEDRRERRRVSRDRDREHYRGKEGGRRSGSIEEEKGGRGKHDRSRLDDDRRHRDRGLEDRTRRERRSRSRSPR